MHPDRGQTSLSEARYDVATLRKVASLAERLKERRLEMVTAREMEAVGAEVGLEPTFIHEALAQLESQRRPVADLEWARRQEFGQALGAFGIGAAWGALAYLGSV